MTAPAPAGRAPWRKGYRPAGCSASNSGHEHRLLVVPWLGHRYIGLSGQLAGPPDVPVEIQGERCDEDRSYDDGVEDHPDRDGEPDLGERHQRQRAERRERTG